MGSLRFLPFALFTAVAAFAADSGDTFTDPAAAGFDYDIQGEYVGEKSAAQVIALGEGKFHIVGYTPGLPGTSDDVEKKAEGDAQRQGDRVVFDSPEWKGEISGGVLTGTNEDGKTYRLAKTERKSPAIGAKPPEGAVILFDGKNADQWKNGKVSAEGWLNMGVKSVPTFNSFSMHLEFRTPFQPKARGQGRGNSGVYIQDRYEVQVLDSFGLKGESNECGGIYTVARPRVNMAFPPLTWQTYDIDFEAAKFDSEGKKTKNAVISVRHNGVVIHDKVELPKPTGGGRPEGPEAGPIQLQNHGNPVAFRNIWVVPKN